MTAVKVMNRLLGIILVVLGQAGVIWGGFAWTTHKMLVDIGPLHATQNVRHELPMPPVIGVMALAAGAALLLMGRRA